MKDTTIEKTELEKKLEEYREKLLASKSIDECEKIPSFEPDGKQNYIFISYAHSDYSQVYSDIANMIYSGVRVWYDEGLSAGINWKKEVEARLSDPCCSGVIFYLSENLFTSASILFELQLVCGNKPYFAVNLTEKQPSDILESCYSRIKSNDDKMVWISTLSGAFKDAVTYLPFSNKKHDSNLIHQIRKQFNVTIASGPEESTPKKPVAPQKPQKRSDFLINQGKLEKYIGADSEISIPEFTTRIADNAFLNNSTITSVVLPHTVVSIGKNAFASCVNLESIVIPSSVLSIDEKAFYGCKNLKSIIFEEGLETIGNNAFEDCESLEAVELPDTVTEIGSYAFDCCDNLVRVKLSSGLEWIRNGLFNHCGNLEAIAIPNGVSIIGRNAFSYCRSLKAVIIPDGVTDIEQDAFAGCSSLESINLPGSIRNLGASAFLSCTRLSAVNIPALLTTIKAGTFMNCYSLTNIELPFGLKTIEEMAFCMCRSLITVEFTKTLQKIEDGAFSFCYRLCNVELSNGLVSIGARAFAECTNLSYIRIPRSVTKIGNGAFKSIKGLTIHTHRKSYAHKYAKMRFIGVKDIFDI